VSVPEKTVERLCLYRRVLHQLRTEGVEVVFSRAIADRVHVRSHQVRRDLMIAGASGVPNGGYAVRTLLEDIASFLDGPRSPGVCLVGAGRLGQALLSYFSGRWRWLGITAAFDRDASKCGRHISGCPCYTMDEMAAVIGERGIGLGILAVPAEEAQAVCDELCASGIRGLLNFAPVRLRVPSAVYCEDVDLTMVLEKVAYYARCEEEVEETRGKAEV
jgi:redox-sensing transcriptional repressor